MKTSEMVRQIDTEADKRQTQGKGQQTVTLSPLCSTTLKLHPEKHAKCKAPWCGCMCHMNDEREHSDPEDEGQWFYGM